ncbi:MAG TPA: membrane protein insertion efficiency factor YidD [Verrucomicrobiae bacterium]|nr:membrane protein insertion efficiency factor YidD [Verrucomicrobiae bacterium]
MKAAMELILKVYKRLVSPFLPPACRYVPTCSEYAAEAVARHGVFHGTMLACWRLLRCNPLARGGFDPVPKKKLESII